LEGAVRGALSDAVGAVFVAAFAAAALGLFVTILAPRQIAAQQTTRARIAPKPDNLR
jgi:hypothetical protein